MEDRRKSLRRERDKDLEDKLLAIENTLQSHLQECAENARAVRQTLEAYHAQNKERLDKINAINQDQMSILETLVAAKRVTVWTAKAVRWIAGLLAAVAGASGLLAYFKTH